MELEGRAAVDGYAFACCDLDLLTQKCNQHINAPKYICDRDWVKLSSLVFEIWYSQSFRDAQTHSHTDGQTRIQNASDIVLTVAKGQKHYIHTPERQKNKHKNCPG